jgi:hypothetical protein
VAIIKSKKKVVTLYMVEDLPFISQSHRFQAPPAMVIESAIRGFPEKSPAAKDIDKF